MKIYHSDTYKAYNKNVVKTRNIDLTLFQLFPINIERENSMVALIWVPLVSFLEHLGKQEKKLFFKWSDH